MTIGLLGLTEIKGAKDADTMVRKLTSLEEAETAVKNGEIDSLFVGSGFPSTEFTRDIVIIDSVEMYKKFKELNAGVTVVFLNQV